MIWVFAHTTHCYYRSFVVRRSLSFIVQWRWGREGRILKQGTLSFFTSSSSMSCPIYHYLRTCQAPLCMQWFILCGWASLHSSSMGESKQPSQWHAGAVSISLALLNCFCLNLNHALCYISPTGSELFAMFKTFFTGFLLHWNMASWYFIFFVYSPFFLWSCISILFFSLLFLFHYLVPPNWRHLSSFVL